MTDNKYTLLKKLSQLDKSQQKQYDELLKERLNSLSLYSELSERDKDIVKQDVLMNVLYPVDVHLIYNKYQEVDKNDSVSSKNNHDKKDDDSDIMGR